MPFYSCLIPETSSSAVLVACPDPLVACTVYLPLFASVTAGITSLARPSLNEICTPGRVAAERTWPSRYQLTSGTGKPKKNQTQKEDKKRCYEMPDIQNYCNTCPCRHNSSGVQWHRHRSTIIYLGA